MKSGYNVLCTFIYIVNGIVSGEIYTAGNNFTLPPAVTALINITSANWPGLRKKQNSLLLLFRTEEFTVPQMNVHWKYIYISTLYIVVQFWFCPPKIVSLRESEIKVGLCGISLFFFY